MLLGHSGEAYFVGERVQSDNGEYGDEIEMINADQNPELDANDGEARQSRMMASKSEVSGIRHVRSSSENPHQLAHLQGVLDGVGIDLEEAKVTKSSKDEAVLLLSNNKSPEKPQPKINDKDAPATNKINQSQVPCDQKLSSGAAEDDLDLAGGYFLQELEEDQKMFGKKKESPKSVKNLPTQNNGLWKSIFGYFKGPANGDALLQKEQDWNMLDEDPDQIP